MSQYSQTTPMQFSEALDSLRRVKSCLVLLLLLCLLVQIAGFTLVSFFGVVDKSTKLRHVPVAPAAETDAATDSADADASHQPAINDSTNADMWYGIISLSLATTKFIAVVAALLLMLTFMFAVKVSLVGRIGATAGFLGAFFWSMILLAMLIPWQQILNSALASGATFNMSQLVDRKWQVPTGWAAADEAAAGFLRQGVFYARFLAYPVLTLLVVLLVSLKFSRGYRPLKQPVGAAAAPVPPVGHGGATESSIHV